MVDRRINFGDPADAGTRYQIEDDANAAGGGNFVLAKDLDGGTVLLQYNPTSDAFEYVRSVDMSGEDVTGVGGVVGQSGAGVYDDATQTVGDGTTSADHASVSTDELGNGPIAFSSRYNTLQAALDAAAGGELYIDDTRTVVADPTVMALGPEHNDTTIEFVGDAALEVDTASSTGGSAVIGMADGTSSDVENITVVRPRITDPNLADADIKNDPNILQSEEVSAIRALPNSTSGNITGSPVNWVIEEPQIDHVQGFGIKINKIKERAVVRGANIRYVAFDGVEFNPDSSATPVCRATEFRIINTGRQGITLAGGASERGSTFTGYVQDTWGAGVDMEDGGRLHLDVEARNTCTGYTNGANFAGLYTTSGCGPLSGTFRSVNPNRASARITGGVDLDGLTVKHERTDGNAQNPDNQPAIYCRGGIGEGTFIVKGGGSSGYAIRIEQKNDDDPPGDFRCVVEDAYAASVGLRLTTGCHLDLTSRSPVQGGASNVDWASHVTIAGNSSNPAKSNTIRVTARDPDGNANYVVEGEGGDEYKNRIEGNASEAYATAATNNLASNNDTSDLHDA